MSNHNSPQMPFESLFDPDYTPDNHQGQTDAANAEIFTPEPPNEVPVTPEPIEISVTPENDPATSRDWFNLARKLRGQNRELLESIVQLEQALAESQQQLQEQGRQARRNDSITTQQSAQLSVLQEQLQASQELSQRQQLEIATLTEQLKTTQTQLAQVERECTLLKQRCQDKGNQLILAQKQAEELEARLQRQQRYALQYKAALDECLSNAARKNQANSSGTASGEVIPLKPQVTPIKAWSEQPQVKNELGVSSATSETKPTESPENPAVLDQTLEELFSLAPEIPEAMRETTLKTEEAVESQLSETQQPMVNQTDSNSSGLVVSQPQTLAVSNPVPFSFAIKRKKPPVKPDIDLPSFLRRSSH
ncbi:conserved hypothetical protein [Rippkaea orientalis PCC 8801]|uniref:Uncharacterized protein n=1 Tax=Rippkaea orientalis (strain PCC 8801 / RF-1) TaxID=41431 RepID=B7JZU9_RIPO1|nr:hypothetical protein [Rippkaea orientalis]ACK65042.1 conserved hypothetical protein [Rippkaea orientalis PCC 8801]